MNGIESLVDHCGTNCFFKDVLETSRLLGKLTTFEPMVARVIDDVKDVEAIKGDITCKLCLCIVSTSSFCKL